MWRVDSAMACSSHYSVEVYDLIGLGAGEQLLTYQGEERMAGTER